MTDNRPTGGNVDITGNPEERLKETFTSPYPVDDTETEWHALIVALANQFEEITATKDAVLQSRFIDDATGEQLDKVGSIFQLERRTGESDSTYRLRLKVELRAALTAGTYEDVLDVISLLIDADTTDITIREYQRNEPTVKVLVPIANFSALEVTGSTFEELIERVTAAGVNGSVSLITPPSSITIQAQPILVATMSELPKADIEVSGTNTEDELLYAGLSSDTLEPLSGDNYRGIEVTATLLTDTTTTFSTGPVSQRTIGPTETIVSAISETTSHSVESEYALSSAQLETLSAAEWQDGTPTQSRFETEVSDATPTLADEDIKDELAYAGLSSDTLEPLSGDNYRGIEVSAPTPLPGITATISTESVQHQTIGATETQLTVVSEATSHTSVSASGLSSNTLEPLSASQWQDGTTTDSRIEIELSVGSVSLAGESTTSETIGPTTTTVSLTAGATSSQNLYAALSSDQLEPLSQGGQLL